MSPISFNFFRTIPTNIDLNGPILEFTKQPVSAATTSGSSLTLTGFATMTFFDNPSPQNTGIITYKWHEDGIGPLDEGPNSTGTATTILTLSNLRTPADNGRRFFLQADYTATAETGNAINEPLNSDIGTITILPLIEIISQPTDASTIVDKQVSFTVNASLTDASFTEGLTFKWSLNGTPLSDGTTTFEIPATKVEQTFSSPGTEVIPASGTNVRAIVAAGSGGRGGDDAGATSGSGAGGRVGTFDYSSGPRTLTIRVGRQGSGGSSGNANAGGPGGSVDGPGDGGRGGGAGPGGWSGGGGGGGALSAIMEGSRFTIVAGGGGGGGGSSWNVPGRPASAGGNFSAVPFSNSGPINPSVSDGRGGNGAGGDGGGGGAGGGGAPGGSGGGGGQDNSGNHATGGNGGVSRFDSDLATLVSQTTQGGDGYVFIEYDVPDGSGTETITSNITASGANTDTLTLRSDAIGVSTVACTISHPTATNSPLGSEDARFVVLDSANQFLLNIAGIGTLSEAQLTSVDLFNGEIELDTSVPIDGVSVSANYWSIHAPDKDVSVEIDMFGGKGSDHPSGSVGGEGGFSRIRVELEQNVEYIITGLNNTIKSPFLYRKANLIAAVGAGGDAGSNFNGGFGGGIGVDGQDGFGRLGGDGAETFSAGTLPSDGIFGSLYSTITPVDVDIVATGVNGGRTIPCSKGVFWRDQGVSACSDVGNTQFRKSDGTIVNNTATITRGYKAGYSITETNGASTTNGGRGGAGAVGGNGGEQGAGGGGGSGYTDGSVTVVSSILGGSNSEARVIIRAFDGGTASFTQRRTSTENVFVEFELISGSGPSTLQFGSRSGFSGQLTSPIVADISAGTVYKIKSTENVDSINASQNPDTFVEGGITIRPQGSQLTLADTDSIPGTLIIVANRGKFENGTNPLTDATYTF